MTKSVLDQTVKEQAAANASGIGYRESFAGHRARLTRLLLERAPAGEPRLCLLGAGNCHDVELVELLDRYAEVHLVDLDAAALARATAGLDAKLAARVVPHAPVDVSGVLDRLERWARLEVTPEELIGHAEATSRTIAQKVGGPFDLVASTCLITQIQRAPVSVLGDRHRLFQAVRHTLSVTHLRVLHGLTEVGGRALLVTDVSADRIAPLPAEGDGPTLVLLIEKLVRDGHVFQVAQPELFRTMVRDDPVLSAASTLVGPLDAWLWDNGPGNRFLVYALELDRKA